MAEELSSSELWILDIIVNLQPLAGWELSQFRTIDDRSFDSEELQKAIERLRNLQLILVEKSEYRISVKVKDEKLQIVKEILTPFWKDRDIKDDSFLFQLEKNAVNFLKLMEFKHGEGNKTYFSFSDYYWDSSSIDICNELAKRGFFFKSVWSSRKHSYQSYYLRSFPFNSLRLLEDFFTRTFKLEGLSLDVDWKIILLTLYSSPVKIEDITTNLPALTLEEVNDILSSLEKRGVIIRNHDNVSINRGVRDLVKQYFSLNVYQPFKNSAIQQLKERLAKRISSLHLIGTVSKILSSVPHMRSSEPFWTVTRSQLRNYSEADLREASKLGILSLTSDKIIIPHEVIEELQLMLRSAFREQTFRVIPANEMFTAIAAWREIFGSCEEYIKIMDEYVNEDTIDIIRSYAPAGLSIIILSSIEGARDLDVNEFIRRLEALKTDHKVEIYFVGRGARGVAPFHERYIISKKSCFMISTSLKQVGKSKSASINMIPQDRKKTLVEPAFDFWIKAPEDALKEKGVKRMSLEAWLASRS